MLRFHLSQKKRGGEILVSCYGSDLEQGAGDLLQVLWDPLAGISLSAMWT